MSNATPGKTEQEAEGIKVEVGTTHVCRAIDLDALLRFNPAFRESPELLKRFLQVRRCPKDRA